MINEKIKKWIDNATYEQLLSRWRFAPIGDLQKKICGRLDKTFGCSKAYGCNKACPIRIVQLTQDGMSEKNLPLND